MEHQDGEQASGPYKPCLQDEEPRSLDDSLQRVEPMSIDQCDNIQEMDDSQLVGAPDTGEADAAATKEDVLMVNTLEMKDEEKVAEKSVEKRRRGRPPRGGQAKTTQPPPPPKKKKDEEDVCFICFDGGSLVLCDRRGCPKAYHPACIKRDESFFRSKAKWNCGWHICSSCQKAAHYMCYTCTYSLCKGCIKDADYLAVRGNKGFCGTCMRTVMLIENIAQENKEMVQVDFDDKSSWEYLFKVYWIYLKEKLSLTLRELTQAKNPWKGVAIMAFRGESSGDLYDGKNDKGSNLETSCGDLESNHLKRRKTNKQPKFPYTADTLITEKSGGDKGMPLPEGKKWATKELLEFVAHMKNGDASMLSQFDVQALLLEYIKTNNLRDPRKKCQIVCDMRLINLFGKERVGHFEMLKLVESHFLIQENSPTVDTIRGGVIDVAVSQLEADGNNDNQLVTGNDKKRKTRKKADDRGSSANPDDYAAIDVHNINLIYLRRNLMENLIDDADKFHDNVVGSIVRIRIFGSEQKQDMYRLVQVVGTSKVAEPYKIGTRTTDVMLEILNLDKKEVISIDGISNQEFSEDECGRLRQSIKCGLIKRLTVGQLQEKAVTLQAVRVNDCLESEILRLNHLRDRASEKGHRKELRECVEKLQLLNSPEERQRRLYEIPDVHTDPNMNPSYESEEDARELDEKKQDNCAKPRNPGFGRKEREPISPQKGGDVLSDTVSRAQKTSATTFEQSKNICTTFYVDTDGTTRVYESGSESTWNKGQESLGLNGWDAPKNQVAPTGSVTDSLNCQAVVRSESFPTVAREELLQPHSAGMDLSVNNVETEKIWHYQDPAGKIQGPFSMVQLRKWSTSGHFPPDLRIWRIIEKKNDAILLTDAMSGQYHKEQPSLYNSYLLPQEVRVASDEREKNWDGGWSGSINATPINSRKVEGSLNLTQNDSSAHCNGNEEFVRSNGWGSDSSSLTTPADVVNSNEGQTGSFLPGWDSLKGNNSWLGQAQVCSSLPSTKFSGKPCETLPFQVRDGHEGERWNSGESNANGNSHTATKAQTNIGHSYEKQADSEGSSGHLCGQNWRPPHINSSSNGCDSNSSLGTFANSLETSELNQEIDFPDLPSPTPKPSHEDSRGQATESKHSVSSNVPVQDSVPSWSTASSLVGGAAQLPEVAGELGGKQSVSSDVPVQDSVPSWNTASSLVGGGAQLPEVAGELGGKQSVSSDVPVQDSVPSWSTASSLVGGGAQLPEVAGELGAKQSVSSDVPVQDSVPSWSTASSLVGGGAQLPEVAGELGGYSHTTAKPSVEEWDSNLVSGSSLKPAEVASDHAATPTSGGGQLTHSSPSHPASNASSWQAIVTEPESIVTEPNEFTSLVDESVSDLLAEVEAMESLNGMASPTSILRCDGELIQGSENDCFSPAAGFSPGLDPGKSDALSSTGDLQMHSQSEPLGVRQADVNNPQKRSGGCSSTSADVEEDTKPSDVSVNQLEAGSDVHAPARSTRSWDMASTDATWRAESETRDTSWGTVQGNANLGWGGLAQRSTNMSFGTGQGMARENASMNSGTSAGNLGTRGSQQRYGGDRFSVPRDRDFQGWDSGSGRGRSSWNRQSSLGNGGSFRSQPKGQRVCKFYESGYCKKGASCSYWHP